MEDDDVGFVLELNERASFTLASLAFSRMINLCV